MCETETTAFSIYQCSIVHTCNFMFVPSMELNVRLLDLRRPKKKLYTSDLKCDIIVDKNLQGRKVVHK